MQSILYNFPALSGGIDIDSDLVVEVAKASSNVCGVKLTCANVGKLTRITAQVNDAEFKEKYPRKYENIPFTAIDGFIDFLLPSIAVGSGGAISGLPNLAPVRLADKLRRERVSVVNAHSRKPVLNCGNCAKALIQKRSAKRHKISRISFLSPMESL